MKKMSNHVARRNRSWLTLAAGVALIGASVLSAESLHPSPTLPNSPIRLTSNENAFGFTPKAKDAMAKYLTSGSYYNRNDVDDLVELLAIKEGVPKNYILTTAGSGPILMMTALAYAEPGANVVTTEMGYTQLIRKFEERGGAVKYAPLGKDMGYDFKAIKDTMDENTKIVYIYNPNNPTGVLANATELKKFVMSVPEDVVVFVDEAYLELSDGTFALETCAPLTKLRKNVIVTRTFSKGYALAGFRIGYGIANPEILKKIEVFYMGAPSYIAAIAAIESVKDQAHLEENVSKYKKVRNYVCDELDKMGIEHPKPDGAFIYFHSGMNESELREAMKENGILIGGSRISGVPPERFADWNRVSIGTMEQMKAFVNTLKVLVKKA